MKIEDLNKEIKECKKCRLCETRKNTLCGEGNLVARVMLLARAPGETENKEGRMFIGPSGKKLDGANVNRSEIYITNLINGNFSIFQFPA